METLWPRVSVPERKAPVTILRERGLVLGQMTANIIYGRPRSVQTSPFYDSVNAVLEPLGMNTPSFVYAFELQSPSLGYSYPLFVVRHVVELYQVTFVDMDRDVEKELNAGDEPLQASSEAEFLESLKKIFNSQKTVSIIQAILTQTATA